MLRVSDTEAVWSRFSDELLGYLRRRVADDALAQDLLQEVFLRVHANIDTQPPAERLGPWVFRIAQNLVVDHHRRKSASVRFEDVQDTLPDEGAEPEALHVPLERALGAWLLGRIEALPEIYQAPVRLSEVEGLSQKQIAARLDLPYSTVKSRVQRGRARLAKDLGACCAVQRDLRGRVLEVEPRGCEC